MKKKSLFLTAMICCLILGLGLSGCSLKPQNKVERQKEFSLYQVWRMKMLQDETHTQNEYQDVLKNMYNPDKKALLTDVTSDYSQYVKEAKEESNNLNSELSKKNEEYITWLQGQHDFFAQQKTNEDSQEMLHEYSTHISQTKAGFLNYLKEMDAYKKTYDLDDPYGK